MIRRTMLRIPIHLLIADVKNKLRKLAVSETASCLSAEASMALVFMPRRKVEPGSAPTALDRLAAMNDRAMWDILEDRSLSRAEQVTDPTHAVTPPGLYAAPDAGKICDPPTP